MPINTDLSDRKKLGVISGNKYPVNKVIKKTIDEMNEAAGLTEFAMEYKPLSEAIYSELFPEDINNDSVVSSYFFINMWRKSHKFIRKLTVNILENQLEIEYKRDCYRNNKDYPLNMSKQTHMLMFGQSDMSFDVWERFLKENKGKFMKYKMMIIDFESQKIQLL
jgi:hypothetical protein